MIHDPYDPAGLREITLAAGESLQFRSRAGMQIITSSGTLVLLQPQIWLGDQVFRAQVPLEAGQSLQLDDGGWATLTGGRRGGSARLLGSEPAWRALLRGGFGKLVAALRTARRQPG